ncbi:death-on-curing protein [Nocardia tenerifensis]|uniref:Death-on-curing protein n=1 Tax=Nocardia tenerifensis TaxID=228006 RepID=A0A318K5T5_9NOCA|nr:type II toxin-antitoxin system death-on-curing family toxin [Nocardia tenerifensis]PXX66820.1 death-on-curing protein [Nocardia tenerifensis]
MIYLATEDVIRINGLQLGGSPAVRDVGLVASAVARPSTIAFGVEAYPAVDQKAAALLHSIIWNHPFVDGNERTGWVACEAFLLSNGYRTSLSDDEAFDLVIRTATTCSDIEVDDIAAALRVF